MGSQMMERSVNRHEGLRPDQLNHLHLLTPTSVTAGVDGWTIAPGMQAYALSQQVTKQQMDGALVSGNHSGRMDHGIVRIQTQMLMHTIG
jgi:hypothetical protein